MRYEDFIKTKKQDCPESGFTCSQLPEILFPFQRDIVQWACKRGKAACFADTGLGKSGVSLSWADQVVKHTGKHVLILTPLAVAAQFIREAKKFGIEAVQVREQSEVPEAPCVVVCNYDMLHALNTTAFSGVVLDESSVIKNFVGATKRQIFEAFKATPYKLACTATPAPNDHMELGQHCDFLDVLPSNEMLSRFFINDTMAFGTYRLKKHAVDDFWDWVCQWARCVGKPSDMGYADDGFVLPELDFKRHVITVDTTADTNGKLFRMPDMSATSVHREKRITAPYRAEKIAQLVAAEPHEPWIIWCDTDYEADELKARIDGAAEVRGSDSVKAKEKALLGFASGEIRLLITKPTLAGFGLNWQHCARVAFVGATYSYEQFYQAVRRCWRFGQKRVVHVHMCLAETESNVWDVLQRKASEHESMKVNMFQAARRSQIASTHKTVAYKPTKVSTLPSWIVP